MQREPRQTAIGGSRNRDWGEALARRVRASAASVRGLTGWRRVGTALGAGALSVLAMPPFFLWPVLLLTLPVLVWLIDGAIDPTGEVVAQGMPAMTWRRLLHAGLVGWCFAYAFHVTGLYWLREAFLVTGGGLALLWPLGVLGLPAYLALYHGLAAMFAARFADRGIWRVVALALGLGVGEWLRGHVFTGFPWNVLGMALTYPLVLMQSASLLGIYGLTIVTVLVLTAPGVILATTPGPSAASHGPHWSPSATAAATCMVPLVLMLAYGTLRLSTNPPPFVEGVKIRLVQPSIDQREKWQAAKQPEFVARHIELSLRGPTDVPDNLAGITHVVWPEAAMPFLPLHRPEVLGAIADALPDGVFLLAGILRLERGSATPGADDRTARDGDRIYNSLAVFDQEGRPVAVYDKSHLVPFGEYLPFQSILESIGLSSLTRQRGGFAIGPEPRPLLAIPGLPRAGPLICYEAVFPGIASRSAGRPDVMINVTNDGWFGNSTGPRQHLHQSRLRSVEEGVPLIRVANNGISAAYDAYGRELARIDLDVAGVADTRLPGAIAPPLYARLGDLVFALISAAILALLLFLRRISNKP